MSTVAWKINGAAVATLDIEAPSLQLFNMAVDRFTFNCLRAVDAAPLFTRRQAVTLTRDNVKWFQGLVNRVPRQGDPQTESHTYEIVGGWWWLERQVFQQSFQSGRWEGETWTPEIAYKTRVVMGQSGTGEAQTSGAVIRDVIAYAIGCGIPIAAGIIDDGVLFPWDEGVDLTCGEVIKRVSRWTPDAMGWFDYSADKPTFHWRRVAQLPIRTVPADSLERPAITPRDDQAVPAVVLKYEVTTEVNDASQVSLVTDAWPTNATGREPGAIVMTLQLSGGSQSTLVQRQKIRVADMPADPNALDWWKRHRPELRSTNIENLAITGATRNAYTLPYELLEGSIQDWMVSPIWNPNQSVFVNNPNPHSHSFRAMPETITALASYTVKDPTTGKSGTKVEKREISVTVTVTNAGDPDRAKTYSKTDTSTTAGESVPEGLARNLYDSINRPQYDGQVTLVDEEVVSTIGMGCRVNIAGLLPAWAAMGTPVQSVEFSLEDGHTQIRIGSPDHLAIQDLVEYMRINRTRRVAGSAADRISGQSNSNVVEMSSQRSRSDSAAGIGCLGEWITVIVDHRLYDNQLQIKTQEVKILARQDPSEWTMIEGGQGEPCDDSEAP